MPLEEGRMQRFVAALLAADGALVEPLGADGLEVLAPPPLQQALGVGELGRFGFGTTLPEGAQRVGIESDWLARFGQVMGERGRWNRRVLDPEPRKAPDAERLLDQELALENATFRLLDAAPAWTRTWCWISASRRCRRKSVREHSVWQSIWRPARCRRRCWTG